MTAAAHKVQERICGRCGVDPIGPHGSMCRECDRKRRQVFYAKNREREIKNAASWNERNSERVAELARNRRRAEPEHHLSLARARRAANPDRERQWRKLSEARRRAKSEMFGRALLSGEWECILAEHGGRCIYCGSSDDLTRDHFWPLSKCGPHEPENLVPACRRCNSRKGSREPFGFCAEMGVQMMVAEHRIQAEILLAVSAMPDTLIWRQNAGSVIAPSGARIRVGPAGVADIVGVTKGRALAIEVKAEDGRQSEAQKNFASRWRDAGGLYILARSTDDVVNVLRLEGLA